MTFTLNHSITSIGVRYNDMTFEHLIGTRKTLVIISSSIIHFHLSNESSIQHICWFFIGLFKTAWALVAKEPYMWIFNDHSNDHSNDVIYEMIISQLGLEFCHSYKVLWRGNTLKAYQSNNLKIYYYYHIIIFYDLK